MTTVFFIIIIALLAWGVRLIRIELKKLERDNLDLRKSNKELLEANFKLTQKSNKNLKY